MLLSYLIKRVWNIEIRDEFHQTCQLAHKLPSKSDKLTNLFSALNDSSNVTFVAYKEDFIDGFFFQVDNKIEELSLFCLFQVGSSIQSITTYVDEDY